MNSFLIAIMQLYVCEKHTICGAVFAAHWHFNVKTKSYPLYVIGYANCVLTLSVKVNYWIFSITFDPTLFAYIL